LFSQISPTLNFNQLVTYKVTFVGDSTLSDKKKSEDCFLFLNDSISLCESSKNFDITTKEKTNIYRLEKGFHELTWAIVKTRDDILTFDSFSEDMSEKGNIHYMFKEELNELNWILQQDTATIQNFKCQKAITNYGGRTWEAWFSSEIPISFGPYKFGGLPGLIISIRDSRTHWHFELTKIDVFEEPMKVSIDNYLNYPISDKKKFFKEKRIYEKNLLEIMEASGISFINPENREIMRKNIEFGIKTRSNWIELYP
jgi:GLPGLI family protein